MFSVVQLVAAQLPDTLIAGCVGAAAARVAVSVARGHGLLLHGVESVAEPLHA